MDTETKTNEFAWEARRDEIDQLLQELDRSQLLQIATKATRLADLQLEATHVVDYGGRDMRPQYLNGTPGRVGRRRGDRREFRPLPGTRAYENGRVWKISPANLRPIG